MRRGEATHAQNLIVIAAHAQKYITLVTHSLLTYIIKIIVSILLPYYL